MTRPFLAAMAAIAVLFPASQQAAAQVIIVPNNPLKERDEYFGRIIKEWYQQYLGRKPNETEHAQMMQKVRVGANAIALQATIIGGDEYYKKHGSSTQGFIQGVFGDILGRKATPAEVALLQAQINGFGRYKFAVEFLMKSQTPAIPVGPVVP